MRGKEIFEGDVGWNAGNWTGTPFLFIFMKLQKCKMKLTGSCFTITEIKLGTHLITMCIFL